MPSFVPTLGFARAFDSLANGLCLRMNVVPGSGKVGVTRQVSQSGRVHEARPPRQACVPEGVQRKIRHLRKLARLRMLFLQSRFLNVSAAGGSPTALAEVYNPPVLVPATALLSLSGERRGQGAVLHAGTSLLASTNDPAVAGEALEIYCTGLPDASAIPPQVSIGGRIAQVMFFGKAPGVSGVNQVNVRVPDGVAPGPATSEQDRPPGRAFERNVLWRGL